MYDLAERDLSVRVPTGPLLGPTTYVTCIPKDRKKNCAPFLSNLERKNCLITKFATEAIYDIRSAQANKIPYGHTIQTSSKRFGYKHVDETPCPTKYNPHLAKMKKPKLVLDPTKPKIYVCAVPHTTTVTAPSIPYRNDENGYDINSDGNIVKVPPTKRYPLDLDSQHLWQLDRGCAWAGRTEKRFSDKYEPRPAPNTYDVQVPRCKRAEEDEDYRQMARLFGFVPRYFEAEKIRHQKELMPGPGTYDIQKMEEDPDRRSKGITARPFISSSARFKGNNQSSPAPNQYEIMHSKKRRSFLVKYVPFGFNVPQLGNSTIPHTPGPGDYDIKGAMAAKRDCKSSKYALVNPSFNNTAVRDLDFSKRDARVTPSSADYPADVQKTDGDEEIVRVNPLGASVFESDVPRFDPCFGKDTLSPATYNVSASFDANRNRKSYHAGIVPFDSTGPQTLFPQPRRGVPCSTTYKTDCADLGETDRGQYFTVSPRFKIPDEVPGPTTYKVHRSITDSFYHADMTYNLRLKENVLGKKLRLAPRQTRKMWINLLKKTKKLKHFDVEMTYEEKQNMLIEILFSGPV